jgi:hypothetical protein
VTPPVKRIVRPGEPVEITIAWSEVCMHLGIAGQRRRVEITPGGMAQIYAPNGQPFSLPVTPGEAGIYVDYSTDPTTYYVEE